MWTEAAAYSAYCALLLGDLPSRAWGHAAGLPSSFCSCEDVPDGLHNGERRNLWPRTHPALPHHSYKLQSGPCYSLGCRAEGLWPGFGVKISKRKNKGKNTRLTRSACFLLLLFFCVFAENKVATPSLNNVSARCSFSKWPPFVFVSEPFVTRFSPSQQNVNANVLNFAETGSKDQKKEVPLEDCRGLIGKEREHGGKLQ